MKFKIILIILLLLLLASCSTTKVRDVDFVELPSKVVIETVYKKCTIDSNLFEIIKKEIKEDITYLELNIKLIEIIKEYEYKLNVISKIDCIKKIG